MSYYKTGEAGGTTCSNCNKKGTILNGKLRDCISSMMGLVGSGCVYGVCAAVVWCPIRLFGLPSAAKLSRESRGYLLVLADLTHLWGGIFIGTTGTKVSIFHIFHVICIDVHFYDKIFRIFQICDILLVDEWQYILSLVICSIIQHWWLILIVGGWLIVAMLQYVMAAHTDPSPAATSAAPSLPHTYSSISSFFTNSS